MNSEQDAGRLQFAEIFRGNTPARLRSAACKQLPALRAPPVH